MELTMIKYLGFTHVYKTRTYPKYAEGSTISSCLVTFPVSTSVKLIRTQKDTLVSLLGN